MASAPAMVEEAPALRLVGLTKEYPGVRALTGVSFDIRSARVHALVGENGAGKSTLISLIAGTNHPTAGGIEIDGTLHPALTPRRARSLPLRPAPRRGDDPVRAAASGRRRARGHRPAHEHAGPAGGPAAPRGSRASHVPTRTADRHGRAHRRPGRCGRGDAVRRHPPTPRA